jgi:hypothetical protein
MESEQSGVNDSAPAHEQQRRASVEIDRRSRREARREQEPDRRSDLEA